MKRNESKSASAKAHTQEAHDLQDRLARDVSDNQTYMDIHRILTISGEMDRQRRFLESNHLVDSDYDEVLWELACEAIMYMMQKNEEYLAKAKPGDVSFYKRPGVKRTKEELKRLKSQKASKTPYYFVKVGDKYGCVVKKFRNLVKDHFKKQTALIRGGATEQEQRSGLCNYHTSFTDWDRGNDPDSFTNLSSEEMASNAYFRSGGDCGEEEPAGALERKELVESLLGKLCGDKISKEKKDSFALMRTEGYTLDEINDKLGLRPSEFRSLQKEFQDALEALKSEIFGTGQGEAA